ncbi:hypothetical protein [Plantactinospora soyae]|uniref:Lysylphosphatidylglycerol synthetase-like protein (DUF2156 family) n=1 Tax=Plantactinospora soyae TaxID=1544732 RepID=A0A927MBH9_9ACTN|nr:hypothetical protein [Plantactinospora soyae]MBE1491527.1 lysylphosphatidylglycerol synthetase-like protein (DUF2156 family) [Plantactinospora soyae]
MTVELWQVPVLVMAGIVILELAIGATARRWLNSVNRMRLRTALIIALAVLVIAGGVVTLGPDLADKLASVAALIVGALALWRPGYRKSSEEDVGPLSAEEGQSRSAGRREGPAA